MKPLRIVTVCVLIAAIGIVIRWRTPGADPEEEFRAARTELSRGDTESVLRRAAVLSTIADYRGHAELLRGQVAAARGRSSEALTHLASAFESDRLEAEARYTAGRVLHSTREIRRAVVQFQQLTDKYPDHVDGWRMLAACWYDLGAMGQALFALEQVQILDDTDFRPHRLEARILHDFERFDDAVPAYRMALQLCDHREAAAAEIRVGLAACLNRLRRYQEALDTALPAADVAAGAAEAAQAALALRNFDQAEQLADRALQSDPTSLEAILAKSQVLEMNGRAAESFEQLETLLDVYPHSLELHVRLAEAAAAAKNAEAAVRYRREAARLADLRESFADLHQAVVTDTEDWGLRRDLFRLAEQLGMHRIALSWITAAQAMASADAQASAELSAELTSFLDRHPGLAETIRETPGQSSASAAELPEMQEVGF